MRELALVFFRVGWLGFGGPIATIAMIEEEVQKRRGWVTPERFAEIYAICKMLPGPVATQVVISLGIDRKGRLGGGVAGFLYILPSFLLVLGISFIYASHTAGPGSLAAFEALQAAALAVIVTSTLRLAQPIWKSGRWIVAACVSGWVVWRFPLWEPLVILAAGLGGALAVRGPPRAGSRALGQGGSVLLDLFWVCFKAGAFTFGTGLAIIPLLEADVVGNHHWLDHSGFMDALAIGQVTPGPVVIAVTFIGYRIAGLTGALIATLGIFIPCFFNILFLVPLVWKRLSGTARAAAFTAWALPAVVGGIFATSTRLAEATLHSWALAALFGCVLAIQLLWKVPAWLLIPGAGMVGVLASRLG